jgi:uncharacterized protein (DUF1697 family)
MEYAALLRGVNVGTTKRIEMKKLKVMFEGIGFTNVSTYINSGNVLFESTKKKCIIYNEVELNLHEEFGYDIPILIKTIKELRQIVEKIPSTWENDESQRTDVAYLFDTVDSKEIITKLPIRKEYIDVRYAKGALYWNVQRENYHKSHLNKLIGHELYQYMTVRNINTARYLAGY